MGPTARLFEALSAARGRRILHPAGVAYEARYTSSGGAPVRGVVLEQGFEHDAVVRFSRGLGVPAALPDFLGIAVRLPNVYGEGRHQDFLLTSAAGGPVGKFVVRPAASFFGVTFTSLAPFDAGGTRVLFGARAAARTPAEGGPLDGLQRAADAGGVELDLLVATLEGGWRRAATVAIGARVQAAVAESLRFNPYNSGGGLTPWGVLNRLRRPAYAGSQEGRPEPVDDASTRYG